MKISRFLTLLFTLCLLISMISCSDDSDSSEKRVLIKGMNVIITDILITSGDEVVINQSGLNTSSLLFGFENHRQMEVKVTGKVFYHTIGTDEKKVMLLIAKPKGDNVDIVEVLEKEDAPEGEEVTLSATVRF